ncbi:MAG: single-stranded DNA-binding protein [Anaerolinea sp.]|nr:single-stranded DNA-binding protein [Anaerolinea sp.]
MDGRGPRTRCALCRERRERVVLKIIATGNLGADPELRYAPSGKAVCNFSLGVHSGRRDPDGNPVTEWLRCTAWEAKADLCAEHLRKGSKVLIEGRPSAHSWTDRAGDARASIEVTLLSVEFLSPRPDSTRSHEGDRRGSAPGPDSREWRRGDAPAAPAAPVATELDDLPF